MRNDKCIPIIWRNARHISLWRIASQQLSAFCCMLLVACLFSCASDKPDYLEPHIATLPATEITRTEATLNGSAMVEGETEMPQLCFRYGMTEEMSQTIPAAGGNTPSATARITGLIPATTYYYMLEGYNGRTTVRGTPLTAITRKAAANALSIGTTESFIC